MTTHSEEDMDVKRLASITADAVSNILYFHTKEITPPADIRHAGLDRAIDAIFHLRSHAADIAVAHLEIACDAAVSYANEYNELHPDNTVNPRWMYICVQALLSHQLTPAMVGDGKKVERLLDWLTTQPKTVKVRHQQKRSSYSDPALVDDDDDSTLSSIEVPAIPARQESMELDDNITAASHDERDDDIDDDDDEDEEPSDGLLHARGGVMKPTPKMPWTEEDTRFLIELRAMGMTHSQTADYLNRGQGAVENKYGRVVNDTTWKPYVTECKARYSKFRREKGKRKLPPEDFHYTDEDRELNDCEAMRRRAVKRQRKETLGAAAELE